VPHARYELEVVATLDDDWCDFRPYVPSIDDAGHVAFQVTRRDGSSVVAMIGADGRRAIVPCPLHVLSHPALGGDDAVSFFARKDNGQSVLVAGLRSNPIIVESTNVGPLGPTMNTSGAVAFRGRDPNGVAAVFVANGRETTEIASADSEEFTGLPVIVGDGSIIFRLGNSIERSSGGERELVIATNASFRNLGRFPDVNDACTVVFVAGTSERSGVFAARDGSIRTIVDDRGDYRRFRGALVADDDHVVFFATTDGGSLGVFTGPDPVADKVIAIGDELARSTVTDLALNPVSRNRHGDLAIRLELANGAQAIVRAHR